MWTNLDVIDCFATDHAPHTAADKAKEYTQAASGISGFETAFGSLMTLVHGGHLTLSELIYRLTAAPAETTMLSESSLPPSSGNPPTIPVTSA